MINHDYAISEAWQAVRVVQMEAELQVGMMLWRSEVSHVGGEQMHLGSELPPVGVLMEQVLVKHYHTT